MSSFSKRKNETGKRTFSDGDWDEGERLNHGDVGVDQSHGFWMAYSLFVAGVASSLHSEPKDNATEDANKLYARQKSFDYYHYQYTRPNRANSLKLIRKYFLKEMQQDAMIWKVVATMRLAKESNKINFRK